MARLVQGAALLSALAPSRLADAEPYTEPSSGLAFDAQCSVAGRPYVLLGAGAHKNFMLTVYAIGLYVDDEDARREFPALATKAGGRTRDKLLAGERAQQFVVWGDFGKLAVIRFVRPMGADKLRGTFEEKLAPLLVETAPPELRARVRDFVALFDRDMKAGDELRLRTTPRGRIEVELAGARKEAPTDARLVRGIWEIWIGPRPISNGLRRALLDRIELLGK